MFPKPVQQPHPPIHIGGESDAALARAARAGQGWHTFNRAPDELAEPLGSWIGLLAEQGRGRDDLTITVCPYFQPLDADIAARYAEAGADAVAALLFAFGPDDVRSALDGLQPVFDRAAAELNGGRARRSATASRQRMATGSDSMPRSTTLVL